jgi:mono/diheme cytochrome c family protein
MKRTAVGFILGLVVPPLLVLIAAVAGSFPIEGDVAPPPWEIRIARVAFDASMRKVHTRQNPYKVDDSFLQDGLKLFQTNCAGCHGGYSETSDWGAHHFYPAVPQFGRKPPVRSAEQIHYIVEHGIRYSGMGGWQTLLTDEQMWKVSVFVSRLDSLPPSVADGWHR